MNEHSHLLSRNSAAAFLDMSVDRFDDLVRPYVPVVEISTPETKRPMVRFRREDLIAFAAGRVKGAAA